MLMFIKKILRSLGYDIRYYHSYWDTVVAPCHIQTVFDIGANNGEYSKEIFAHIPEAEVYAFEPLSDCFETLTKSFEGNPHMHAFKTALGDSLGETTIERSSFHPSSSLLPMAKLHKELYPKTADSTKEKIAIARLDDVAKNIDIKGKLMIKIDVQGFEDKVIAGGKNTFARASVILVETSFVELYEGQPLFSDINKLLVDLGFSYGGVATEHRDKKTGELLYQDSLFVKKS